MILKYPYESKKALNFGDVPTIKLQLLVESSIFNLVRLNFLFDTGADVTSLPASAAKQLGINLTNCPTETMTGYEGGKVKVYISQINIKFDKKLIAIPCVFNPTEYVPVILGRAGILSRFNIYLDGKKKEVTFEEI